MVFTTPSIDDVICGGSRIVRCHPGNQRFENMIHQHLDEYEKASKKSRSDIISTIVNEVRNRSKNGGFVQKDSISKNYYVVPDHRAVRFPILCQIRIVFFVYGSIPFSNSSLSSF
jgi:N-terminal of Par3 and HAL proteins